MVVFTCQHCGDAVKKPVVEKHYNTKCRFRSPHLTCVDCLQDFCSEDYGKHNQCMTEDQRYSAHGTVFKEEKGKKKQEMYIEMIQKIVNSENLNLSSVQKNLLEVCSNSDNVPKKPKPFENFIRNVARNINYNIKDIQRVFNVIDEAWKKQNEANNASRVKDRKPQEIETTKFQESSKNHEETHNKTNEDINDGNDKFTNDQTNKKSKKVKNKTKISETSEMDVVSQETRESLNENSKEVGEGKHDNELKKAKKEKQKNKSFSLNNEVTESLEVNGSITVSDSKGALDDTKASRKQIKKQKKYEKYLEELENEGNIVLDKNQMDVDAKEPIEPKKKSKKNKKLETNECESESQRFTKDKNIVDQEYPTLKAHNKENKKRKFEDCAIEVPEKKTKEHSEDGAEATTATSFNWGEVIMNVLISRPDKELSLKKLGKKVVNEYQAVRQDHKTYEELLAKFNKKVSKTKGVRVLRDRAKLIE